MNTTQPDPLYGYQLCSADDPQRTHAWCENDKEWFPITESWKRFHPLNPECRKYFCRKQPAQKGGEWVEIAKHGRPTEPGRYWCWNGYESLHFKVPYPETSWAGITHWMKCALPDPPPKSPAEKAWGEFQDEAKDWSPKAMLLAGFAKGGGR